jgi:hypothetical protein
MFYKYPPFLALRKERGRLRSKAGTHHLLRAIRDRRFFRRSRIVQKVSAILLGVDGLVVNVIRNLELTPWTETADHPLLEANSH